MFLWGIGGEKWVVRKIVALTYGPFSCEFDGSPEDRCKWL